MILTSVLAQVLLGLLRNLRLSLWVVDNKTPSFLCLCVYVKGGGGLRGTWGWEVWYRGGGAFG